jgi:hypothetical protein
MVLVVMVLKVKFQAFPTLFAGLVVVARCEWNAPVLRVFHSDTKRLLRLQPLVTAPCRAGCHCAPPAVLLLLLLLTLLS